MINDEVDAVIEELFQSLLSRYHVRLETSLKGSDFIFHCVLLLHYKCQRINFKCSELYIDSPDLIKEKKTTTNSISKIYNKYFQYAITVALDHEKIGVHPERITKIKSFINKYNWEKINYLPEKDDWKKFEKNNLTIALNVLYEKQKNLYLAYVSKQNQIMKNKLF